MRMAYPIFTGDLECLPSLPYGMTEELPPIYGYTGEGDLAR